MDGEDSSPDPYIVAERLKAAEMRTEAIRRLTADGRFRVTRDDGNYAELQDTITGYWLSLSA